MTFSLSVLILNMEWNHAYFIYTKQKLTPIGNKFTAFITRPDSPMRKKGWMGIGCERGASMIPGATTLVIDPIKRLDFIMAAGTAGKAAKDSARIVRLSPEISSIMDTSIEIRGPLMATSNNAERVEGNDLRGVIEPNVPSCTDGRGTGNPIFTPRIFAAIAWPASCNAETAKMPKKIGRHNGTAVTSFSFTTALKKVGLRANALIAYANAVKAVANAEKAARDLVPRPRSDSCSGSTSLARAIITGGGPSSFASLLPIVS